jgi:outer membrane protein
MKLSVKLLTPFLFSSLMAGSALGQGRIATIDMGKVFDNYWRTKQAQANIEDQRADMKKELDGFVSDYNKAKEEYQKLLASASDQALSVEERDNRKGAAEKKLLDMRELEQTISQYQKHADQTLREKVRRMQDNIVKEIRDVVNAKAKSAGYTLVLDVAGTSMNNVPVVIYSNGENDLTKEILDQLNAGAPPDLPKASEKKDEGKKDGRKPVPEKSGYK